MADTLSITAEATFFCLSLILNLAIGYCKVGVAFETGNRVVGK
jgi:hypothetical protein